MNYKYKIEFHKDVFKDFEKIKSVGSLYKKAKTILKLLENNPFENPPVFEKLQGDLKGLYSRRLNLSHRIVYKIEKKTVKILSMWSHYE
ncbi:MAG: Txe/YoeB family addiction module toxin [Elusimicrobiota bacterium]|nr:Txe/YoeB family addiction module toxin [Elusimicrobiota bacterium]